MKKTVYLFGHDEHEPHEEFTRFVENNLEEPLLKDARAPWRLSCSVERPPAVSLVPFKKDRVVMVSVEGQEDRWTDRFGALSGFRGSWLVDEALPVDYEKTWPDGQPTPGAALLTLMHRNPRLSEDEFLSEWFGRHTPMSLKIHPLWRYERNQVLEALGENSEEFDGIVVEHFENPHHLHNPVKMFGGWFRFLPNMARVGLHIKKFIDMSRIENYLVTERVFSTNGDS